MFRHLQANSAPDTRVHVWDTELDTIESFDFATGQGSGVDEEEKEGADLLGRSHQAAEIAGRRPVAQFWDPTEPRLLVCETVQVPGLAADLKRKNASRDKSSKKSSKTTPAEADAGSEVWFLNFGTIF